MPLLRRKTESPIAVAEREVSDLQSRHAALTDRLQSTEAELARALATRRDLLIAGDLSDAARLSEVEQKVTAWAHSRDGLVEALGVVNDRITAANGKLVELRDRAERTEVARQATVEVEAIVSVLEDFRKVSARLTAAIEPLATRISSAADFLPRTQLLLGDIASVSATLAEEGRSFAARTEAGSEPIHRPTHLALAATRTIFLGTPT